MKYDTCITIFGGTGDLTFRKLLPALYTMSRTRKLSARSKILLIGRRDYNTCLLYTSYRRYFENPGQFGPRRQPEVRIKSDAYSRIVRYMEEHIGERLDVYKRQELLLMKFQVQQIDHRYPLV